MSARQRRAKSRRRRVHASTRRVVPAAISGVIATSATLAIAGPEVSSASAATFSPSIVQDINLVNAGSRPSQLTQVGTKVFFTAYRPGIGTELWESDGTAAGTLLVKDINAGPSGSYP